MASITTEPIPDRYSLRPGLVFIVITDDDRRFQLPVQWEAREAAELILEIKGVAWQLNADGLPIQFKEIIEICNQYCYRKVGFIPSLAEAHLKKKL